MSTTYNYLALDHYIIQNNATLITNTRVLHWNTSNDDKLLALLESSKIIPNDHSYTEES